MERKRIDEKSTAQQRRAPSGAALIQPELTRRLHRALFEEWAQYGYSAISLERVAQRAGVGKAALYRRWSDKRALASDTLTSVGLAVTEIPDTGTLAGDVAALLRSLLRLLRHPIARRVLPDLHAELGRGRDLAEAAAQLAAGRRGRAMALLDRAVARGELPGSIDRELAADLLAAPLYWRLIATRGRTDRAYLDRLTAALLAALRAC